MGRSATKNINKDQRDALISQIYFGIELCMFRTGLLSIIRSLVLYTQQYIHVMYFIIVLKPCNLYLLYAYVPTKLHLNLLY